MWAALILLVVLVGLLLRLWALGRQPVNADQAVVALMARGILHGHFEAFYWGQPYGGGEPYVVALFFAVFGQSFFVLGLTPLFLDVIAALLVFCLGRRLFSTGVGIGAALLFWIWPEATLWQSTMEYGFRFVTLDCGLAASVVALRLVEVRIEPSSSENFVEPGRGRYRDVTLVGLLLGIGWWSSPEIVYFALPIGILLAVKLIRRRLRLSLGDIAALTLSALVGALPWLWANFRSGFASLRPGVQPYPGFWLHLRAFLGHAFPIAAGVQMHGTGRWLGGGVLGPALGLAIAAALLFFVAWCVLEQRKGFVILFCLLFPVLYALSPFTWYWHDARYVVYLVPLLAIVLVAGAVELFRRRRFPQLFMTRWQISAVATVVMLGLLSTLVTAAYKAPFNPDHVAGSPQQHWTTFSFDPNSFEVRLASDLNRAGVHDAVAGYWLAYPLDIASHGQLAASDIVFVRSAALLSQVEHSPEPAWLFGDQSDAAFKALVSTTRTGLVDPGCAVAKSRCLTAVMFQNLLRGRAIAYRQIFLVDDGIEVVIPARKIAVSAVLARLHATSVVPSRRATRK